MSRVDGRKVVGVAVVGITAAIAVGQIYLPFFMDRSALRGDKPMEERRDLIVMRGEASRSDNNTNTTTNSREQLPSSKSMWQNMKRKDQ
jgi:hypothetical protein